MTKTMANEMPKMPPCKEPCVEIRLSRQEYEKLIDCLFNHDDCGPSGSGWRSMELESLIESITRQGEDKGNG